MQFQFKKIDRIASTVESDLTVYTDHARINLLSSLTLAYLMGLHEMQKGEILTKESCHQQIKCQYIPRFLQSYHVWIIRETRDPPLWLQVTCEATFRHRSIEIDCNHPLGI